MNDTRFEGKYRIPSARLAGYDYGSNGLYFITICTKDRIASLGHIDLSTATFRPSAIGQVAIDCWQTIPIYFPFVELDAFQVMPNHLHGILGINKALSAQTDQQVNQFGPQSQNIASILRGYKSAVTKHATLNQLPFGWQPRFYDRVIRNNDELNRIRQYIESNPAKWVAEYDNNQGLFM